MIKRHSSYPKYHPALPGTRAAWCSLLLTFSFLAGIAWMGFILRIHRPWGVAPAPGICIIETRQSERLPHPLPAHTPPTEQSTPEIPFSAPLLHKEMVDVPDINTTPDEPLSQLPPFDIPETLGALQAPPVKQQKRPITRRVSVAAAPAQIPPRSRATTSLPTTPPSYKSAPPPPYPPEMKSSRIQGTVRVRIAVNPSGIPTAVYITAGSGHPVFDTTATRWILQHWRFHPALRDGVAVESSVNTRVEFILDKA